ANGEKAGDLEANKDTAEVNKVAKMIPGEIQAIMEARKDKDAEVMKIGVTRAMVIQDARKDKDVEVMKIGVTRAMVIQDAMEADKRMKEEVEETQVMAAS